MAKLDVGKYYVSDRSGEKIHILAEVTSSLYGKCFCAESTVTYGFRAITSAHGWTEITENEFDISKK